MTKASASLYVDYGLKRVTMSYRVSLGDYYKADVVKIIKWCETTFASQTWIQSGTYPGYIYFVKDSDTTLFLMRWA